MCRRPARSGCAGVRCDRCRLRCALQPWNSVEAQRRAVRRRACRDLPAGSATHRSRGGTGEDALWLCDRGHDVLMTDASPAMVADRISEMRAARSRPAVAAEDFGARATELAGEPRFDGAYFVFAGLNCVSDLTALAVHIARLLCVLARRCMLVMFGTCCPGEMFVRNLATAGRATPFAASAAATLPRGSHGRELHRPISPSRRPRADACPLVQAGGAARHRCVRPAERRRALDFRPSAPARDRSKHSTAG